MFEALHKLTSEGKCSLIITVAAKGENLVVRLAPLPTEKDAPAALSQKLELEGSPAELDGEIQKILASYSAERRSLQDALADAATVMQAAATQASHKAVSAIAKGAAKPDADTKAGSVVAPQPQVAPVENGDTTIDLFGAD